LAFLLDGREIDSLVDLRELRDAGAFGTWNSLTVGGT
jgi:hypothetical protein